MDQNKEYYIGLDGGTDSVGWAVLNPDYTVVKKRSKSLWGVRLFESGQTAAERRLARSARRRTDRKKWRLKLLKELFAEEVSACDPAFFARLAESRYWEDDKKVDGADTLFHDADFTDKDYHRQFPTIYHLRRHLMCCTEKPDIRLLYLAVAHMIKNRGHFLNEGQDLNQVRRFDDVWQNLCAAVSDVLGIELAVENGAKAAAVLTSSVKIKEKTKQLESVLGEGESEVDRSVCKALAGLLAGAKVSAADLFNGDEALTDCGKFSLAERSIEELETDLGDALGEERFSLLQYAYAAYNWAVFARLLPEGKTISEVKTEEYEAYKADLRALKQLVKQYAPDQYYRVFRSAKIKGNYASYVGKTNCGNEKSNPEPCKPEEFFAFLKKELKPLWSQNIPAAASLAAKLESGTLLRRQRSGENAAIPYQAHLQELQIILKNMQQFYPFLQKADENGFTPAYKIEKLLTFRIPYYVGPLNDAHKEKGFCWIVKKADVPVLPWNFDQVVDENACEDAFIGRMSTTCTYLVGENVLPQNSPLYCRFMVLNELNNLRIRGEKITPALKQAIFTQLFCAGKGGKVTQKKLLDFLHSQGIDADKQDISGIDGDFKASMAPAVKLQSIFHEPLPPETLECLAFALTVSGESRKMLQNRIRAILPNADNAVIRKVCALKFTGWGRLSQKLLTEIYDIDQTTGECRSLMDLLWSTNNNLMQLLSGDFTFAAGIDAYNAAQNGTENIFDYDHLVKDLYVSPSVKRGLWQTLLLVKEVRKIMGCDPARVFIEMARGASPEQKNKRTVSRKNQLLALYKACKEDARDWCGELEALPEDKLRSDKLYLYYTQMGRCMYSGEPIRLDDLMHDTANQLYDIDHIYPQSKTKDDSLTNRVLVKRQLNAIKSNDYPLPQAMRQTALWKALLEKGLISKQKYLRLTRTTPFTEEELADFINRQLVETRQSTKAAAHLLEQLLPNTDIVYVKAGLAADFRQEFGFVKCRDANDFHHAKDAYLNAVVGNVYHEKFTKNPLRFVRSGQEYSLNLSALFQNWNIYKGGRVIWQKGEDGSLETARARMAKNDPLVTRYCTEGRGALYDLQPMKKSKGQLPLKSSDERLQQIDRYGGYNKLAGAYFALAAYYKKGKRVKSIESVPLYLAAKLQRDPAALQQHLADQLGTDRVEILIPEIKLGTLFKWDGYPMTLSGRTGPQLIFRNAAELRTSAEQEQYIKKMSRYLEKCKGRKEPLPIRPAYDKLTPEENLQLYDAFTQWLTSGIYAKRLSLQGKFLLEKRDAFAALSPEAQVRQLMEILHLFQCNPVAANLSELGGVAHAGILLASKNIDGKVPVFIVHQSVTGYFTQEVRLNDL